jgi:hypothetical protein
MFNIIILYWEPGSGGDFIQSLLLSDNQYRGVVTNFNFTDSGRISPTLDLSFKELFESNLWYFKEWSHEDCCTLADIIKAENITQFVIPTHRVDQISVLQKYFSNSVSVGITYPENMFPIVLKNWCKKVAQTDSYLGKIYNQPVHQYLKNNNVFGEFVLKEQLRFGTRLRTSVEDVFDVAISLEKLYLADLSDIHLLISDQSTVYDNVHRWLSAQGEIQQYCFTVHTNLKDAIGYNSKAVIAGKSNIKLDSFDNILIKEYFLKNTLIKNVPIFKTLKQADTFLTSELAV